MDAIKPNMVVMYAVFSVMIYGVYLIASILQINMFEFPMILLIGCLCYSYWLSVLCRRFII